MITAGSGLVGAIVGSVTTLAAGGRQHRRTVASERSKEARAREVTAAQRASALLTDLDHRQMRADRLEGEESTAYASETSLIRDQLHLELLYLPTAVRKEVEFSLEALHESGSLYHMGHFYWQPYSISRAAVAYAREVLAACASGAELPSRPTAMVRIAAALQDLDAEYRDIIYADEIAQSDKDEKDWLARHPELATTETQKPRTRTMFRRVTSSREKENRVSGS
ncbi:hypothetical protein [Pseudonocardia sp. T1-2H]|uniref:hypothetical protein n=1 Tax=Pseudonocardia sp. T1-2H TaxID=3128899 RepID=UPI003101638A